MAGSSNEIWTQRRIRAIVNRWLSTHPDIDGIAIDKLIETALRDSGYDPDGVLAAVAMQTESEWLRRQLTEAAKIRDPEPELFAIPRPAAVEIGQDERGVPVYSNGARATVDQVITQLEVNLTYLRSEEALRAKEFEAARTSRDKLRSYGVDTSRTAYEDVPAEIAQRLREELS